MPAPCRRSSVTVMPEKMMSQRLALRPGIKVSQAESTTSTPLALMSSRVSAKAAGTISPVARIALVARNARRDRLGKFLFMSGTSLFLSKRNGPKRRSRFFSGLGHLSLQRRLDRLALARLVPCACRGARSNRLDLKQLVICDHLKGDTMRRLQVVSSWHRLRSLRLE